MPRSAWIFAIALVASQHRIRQTRDRRRRQEGAATQEDRLPDSPAHAEGIYYMPWRYHLVRNEPQRRSTLEDIPRHGRGSGHHQQHPTCFIDRDAPLFIGDWFLRPRPDRRDTGVRPCGQSRTKPTRGQQGSARSLDFDDSVGNPMRVVLAAGIEQGVSAYSPSTWHGRRGRYYSNL